MSKYTYRAMKPDGKKVEEQYEAQSRNEVYAMIASLGYYPLKIEEIKTSKSMDINFNQRITAKDLSLFCRQMYTMLDAGISITNCLSMLATQVNNKKLRGILGEIEEDVKRGEMLSASMKKYPKDFPQLLISMVQSGEASGTLDGMMERMASHFEKEFKINNKVRNAMIYPAVLSVITVVAVGIIMIFVMPTFQQIFDSEGAKLPWITSFLIGVSNFMSSNILVIILMLGAIVFGLIKFKETDKGYEVFSIIKLKIPVISDLTKKVVVSRFTRTLSTLLSSGVSMMEALPIVTAVLRNKVAEEEMEKIKERVMRGDGLSEPIKDSLVFPNMLASMIRIGEESGALDDMLLKTADFYDEEVEQAITATTALIEPALIVVMGVIIGSIVAAIMLPMFNMYQSIK